MKWTLSIIFINGMGSLKDQKQAALIDFVKSKSTAAESANQRKNRQRMGRQRMSRQRMSHRTDAHVSFIGSPRITLSNLRSLFIEDPSFADIMRVLCTPYLLRLEVGHIGCQSTYSSQRKVKYNDVAQLLTTFVDIKSLAFYATIENWDLEEIVKECPRLTELSFRASSHARDQSRSNIYCLLQVMANTGQIRRVCIADNGRENEKEGRARRGLERQAWEIRKICHGTITVMNF